MMNSKALCCSYCHAEEREFTDIGCFLFETVVKGALRKESTLGVGSDTGSDLSR